MKVLVTGGAGYIGSHLVDALLAQGHDVCAVDDLSTGRLANLAHLSMADGGWQMATPSGVRPPKSEIRKPKSVRFVQGSILDEPLMDRLVAEADQVYHLAAVVGVKNVVDDPARCIAVNVGGTEMVLEKAFKHGKRTVIVSSSEVYGKSTEVPLSEDADCLLGSTAVPRWSYALGKAIDEHLALALARKGLPVTVVRYFNSYGPRLHPLGYGSVVARFITQALEGRPMTVYDDGRQTRCFTYVADTVRGTILAGTLPQAVGKVFNVGSDREIAIVDLARMIRDLAGSTSEIETVPHEAAFGAFFEETRRRVPDVRRAAQVLGFRAETPLEEGLGRTVEWFRPADRRT